MTDEPTLGDRTGNPDFDDQVNEALRRAGVPPLPAANPDRTRVDHDITQQVTGARPREVKFSGTVTGRVPRAPQPQTTPYGTRYDTNSFAKVIDKTTFPWIGVLGAAQAAGHDVSVHLRDDPVAAKFVGKVVNEPPLADLDELAAASIKTVKIERDTGSAPRREITTVLLTDVAAITVIEKR